MRAVIFFRTRTDENCSQPQGRSAGEFETVVRAIYLNHLTSNALTSAPHPRSEKKQSEKQATNLHSATAPLEFSTGADFFCQIWQTFFTLHPNF